MSSSNWTILVWSVLSLCQATSFWKNECPTISWFSSIAWNDSHIPCCHCWLSKETHLQPRQSLPRDLHWCFSLQNKPPFPWKDRIICQKALFGNIIAFHQRPSSFSPQVNQWPSQAKKHIRFYLFSLNYMKLTFTITQNVQWLGFNLISPSTEF